MEWILLVQTRNVGLVTNIPTAEYLVLGNLMASIRKLGNRRSSEGLCSFKPSKETNSFILIILAGDIEMNPGPRFQCGLCKKYCKASEDSLNVRNAKNDSTLHAQTLVTTNL